MYTGYKAVKAGCGLFAMLAVQAACGGIQSEAAEASRQLFAMDTFMTLTAYGTDAQEAVDAAADEITRLDAILSTGDSESEIYQINQQGGGILSEDTAYLVERSLSLYQETDGAFDIAIYPVMEAWGFTTDEFRVPEESELEELLTRCDAGEIQYDPESKEITFGMDGMRIDLGGIAKGYTSGRIMDIFREYGITSGLVNLGGNVQTCGTKTDGSLWRVAVQDPADSEEYIGILSVSDQAVITSGGYERYFEEDGRTYHHIIDPTTGYPAENGLISVTVISSDGTLADGLSTSLYIMGLEQAVSYWESRQDLFDMVLMTDDREIYVTEGIAEQFASDYEWNRITGNEDWK
jgi:thiamine biosynthesis lipoprotein